METPAPLRPRALAAGFLASAALAAATPWHSGARDAVPLGGGHFPLAPFALFFLLVVAAGLWQRLAPRRPPLFSGRELLVIFGLSAMTSGIGHTGLLRTFFILLTAPRHMATAGNHWESVLWPLLPKAWYPADAAAVEEFYNGLPGGRDMGLAELLARLPWSAWLMPMAVFSVFILISYALMLFLVSVFSRQWVENERLNFPLLALPLSAAESLDSGRLKAFVSDRFLLAGFFLPVFLHGMNGLHFYFPSVPEIPTLFLPGGYFPKEGLLSGFVKLRVAIYPAFIGFAFLASRQVSLSFWFFFIAGLLVSGFLAAGGGAPNIYFGPNLVNASDLSSVGAFLVFFLFLLFLSRAHLAELVRCAFFSRPCERSRAEIFSARASVYGVAACYAALVLWCRFFGMETVSAVAASFLFFMALLVASRIVCQGAVAYFTLTAAPTDGLLALFGSSFFTPAGLLVSAVIQKMLFMDLRESLMPTLFHAAKIKAEARAGRLFSFGVVLVLLAGLFVSFAAGLSVCYKYGARDLDTEWAVSTTAAVYDNVRVLAESPEPPDRRGIFFMGAGAAAMLALVLCFHRFVWWPLHPLGLLMASSSAMRILWFSFFAGWLANALSLRYGGAAFFSRMRLFFMGLIAGDFVMAAVFAAAGHVAGSFYAVFPV